MVHTTGGGPRFSRLYTTAPCLCRRRNDFVCSQREIVSTSAHLSKTEICTHTSFAGMSQGFMTAFGLRVKKKILFLLLMKSGFSRDFTFV